MRRAMEEKMSAICNYCDKSFTKTRNLYAHIRNIHETVPVYQKMATLICPYCKILELSYTHLRSHLVEEHDEEIEVTITEFKNQDDFIKWKEKMEKENMCKYVKSSGKKRDKKTYYVCHRSHGGPKVLGDDKEKARLRKQRKQGVGKVAVTCPSTMVVTEVCGLMIVTLHLPHLGHLCTMDNITLTKTERAIIAEKLSAGFSFDRILDDIQCNVDSNFERINLLNRQDLRNIKREFMLDVDNGSPITGLISKADCTNSEEKS